jgi:hypothetical protein
VLYKILRNRSLLKVIVICGCAFAWSQPYANYHYQVSTDADLKKLYVNLCFEGAAPRELVAESLDASVALVGAWYESGEEIKLSGVIPIDQVLANACLNYQVDISRGIQRHDMTGPKVYRSAGATGVSNGLWFWRPEVFGKNRRVLVEFDLPDKYDVATSWSSTPNKHTFEVPKTPYDWPSWIVLGQFFKKEVTVGATQIDVSILHGSPEPDMDALLNWIESEAAGVDKGIGAIPFSNVHVFMFPNARARQPVPVAYVTRGGGPTLHMMINQRRSMDEFFDDWTATHELSHLFLPFINPEDAWFYEGFASYYQYVVRARMGAIDQMDAWSKLIYGFRRGSREAEARELTLLEATEKMYEGEPFMQVYWAGAALMLIADVHMRQAKAWSLDRVVREFNACCMERTRAWTAQEVLLKFDEIYGSPLFIPLMRRYVNSNDFPDLTDAFRSLGLKVTGSVVTLIDGTEQRSLRNQIMSVAE